MHVSSKQAARAAGSLLWLWAAQGCSEESTQPDPGPEDAGAPLDAAGSATGDGGGSDAESPAAADSGAGRGTDGDSGAAPNTDDAGASEPPDARVAPTPDASATDATPEDPGDATDDPEVDAGDGENPVDPPPPADPLSPAWQLDCAALPADGPCQPGPRAVLTATEESGRVALFDSADGSFLGYLPVAPPFSSYRQGYAMTTQGPDACLWVTQEDGPVQRWDTDGTPVDAVLPLETHYAEIDGRAYDLVDGAQTVSFTPDGVYVAAGTLAHFGLDGSLREHIALGDASVADVVALRDGRLVVADDANWSTYLLDLEQGERTPLWPGPIPVQVAHAGAGQVLVANRNLSDPVGLVDLATQQRTEIKPGVGSSGNVFGIGLLADDRWLLTGSATPTGVGILDPNGVPKGRVEVALDDPGNAYPFRYGRVGRACLPEAVIEAARPRALGTACTLPADTAALYEADFELVNLDAVVDPGLLAAIDDVGAGGSRSSLRVTSGSDPEQRVSLPLGGLKPAYVRFDLRVSETADANDRGEAVVSGQVLLDAEPGDDFDAIERVFFSRGALRTGNTRLEIPAEDASWHHVELVDFDWDARTYDVCIDGTLRATKARLRDSRELDSLELKNSTEGTQMWIDNVLVK